MNTKSLIKEKCYQAIGRMSNIVDLIRPLFKRKGDKTEMLIKKTKPLKIWRDKNLVFAFFYDSLAHSFYRSPELSLFFKYTAALKHPIVDFGCGDGSFASVLFNNIDYGIDIDKDSLKMAESYGIYEKLLQSSSSFIPLKDSSVNSVFSNSVLEHVTHINDILAEINRILYRDGIFMFTVELSQYEYNFEKYFGRRALERISPHFHHHTLLNIADWKKLLASHGFSIVLLKQYQPDWFTFWYRMFRLFSERSGLGFFSPGIGLKLFMQFKPQIFKMVNLSIKETEKASNLFVIVKKRQDGE